MRIDVKVSATGILGMALFLLVGGFRTGHAQGENKPAASADQPLQADPANDLFQLALHSYREAGEVNNAQRKRETYLAAIRQFDRFHSRFPTHPNAVKSRYYKAICHQKVGNNKAFRESLSEVVENHAEGSLVGAAAYQLAAEYYEAKNYAEAEPLFELAARETDSKDFGHRAVYSRALCFEKLGLQKETISALKAVLTDSGSPFQTQAQRVLAHYYAKADLEEEALAYFLRLAISSDKTTRADAVLQCAQISRKLGKKDLARKYFEDILVTPGLEQWRGEAQLSLMSEAALDDNPERVIAYYKRGAYQLDEEGMARRLQIAAEAYESLGETGQSTALFKELAEIAPDSMTALEAGYLVLSRDYKTSSRILVKQARDFLRRFENEHPEDPRIHNARLMLAESYHRAGRYGPAAQAYAAIDLKHIALENHPGIRFRLANTELRAGNPKAALVAFNTFIEHHPQDEQVSNAIVNRAEIYLDLKDSAKAHLEFNRLLSGAKRTDLKEYAWAQKALLYKKTIDTTPDDPARQKILNEFAVCHAHLISDFPGRDPARRAASEFWRGWALYRQNKFADCLGPFRRARQGDASELGRGSTLHLALAHYHLRQRDELRSELDALLRNYREQNIPRPVFAWLGSTYHKDGKYAEAWAYLQHAITPKKPTDTTVAVWRAAGRSALEAGAYEASLRPLEIVLEVEESPYRKAETQFFLGSAHLALKDPERARTATEACLTLKPQGLLNSRARLQLGDIAMAQGDPNTAAQFYVPVIELYGKDPAIREKALRRAIRALELKDTEEARQASLRYRERLQALENTASPAPSG